MRYNLYRSAQINGTAAPGYSSDQATAALEEVFAQTMPREMGYDYIGMSFQEKKAQEGVPPAAIFGLSLLFVFLILAALYESWSLPVQRAARRAGRRLRRLRRPLRSAQMENNVFAQIGLIMLIGLAAKNAILIVEFARTRYEHGVPLARAALEGARIRLRPILMTSFAFILGCVPLWLASGSGAVARKVMGTAVIGGMLAASVLAIFLIPVTFYVVEMWATKGEPHSAHAGDDLAAAPPGAPGAAGTEPPWSHSADDPLRPWPPVARRSPLAGCAVGPNYKRPDTQRPGRLPRPGGRTGDHSLADLAWWDLYRDPPPQRS